MTRNEAIHFLLRFPVKFGKMLGFTKLENLHNEWMKSMLKGTEDETLQAHRGSYKTTCVSIVLALIIILMPNKTTLFIRKTDSDVKEVIRQVVNILKNQYTQYFVHVIYGCRLKLTVDNANEVSTNLTTDIKGTSQLVGLGLGSSLTGKHFDFIFTDDIVNILDRLSKAERERTKVMYQELQNVKNRGGRIFNTGTPWHKDDAFKLMPNPKKYDCYSTGLITAAELEEIKNNLIASLFAANYELRHIAAEDVIFDRARTGADPTKVMNGSDHIDAAYDGEDFTAYTIARKVIDYEYDDEGNKTSAKRTIYVLGKMWRKHVDDVEDRIIELHNEFLCPKVSCEENADKGYLAKDLRKKGIRVHKYHENMNKFLKITSYLKAAWKDVVFVDGTDPEYIEQICDYNENAEHDDAPDSLASLVRLLNKKNDSDEEYEPIWSM